MSASEGKMNIARLLQEKRRERGKRVYPEISLYAPWPTVCGGRRSYPAYLPLSDGTFPDNLALEGAGG